MRQKWGQNFLVAGNVARRIVDALCPFPEDEILEIGPGRGALTGQLVGRVKGLRVVELDRDLCRLLVARWGNTPGFEAVNADFLAWPLPAPVGQVKVVGNLPYSAAGAILRRLLDWSGWSVAVVMVQKEVADRIAAGPGGRDYGILSLAVQAKAAVERLFLVPPGCFRPRPKVTSAVLRLTRLEPPMVAAPEEEAFFRVVKAAFSQRRKTLLNSLSAGLKADKAPVEACLAALGIAPDRRAETLSLEEFRRLAAEAQKKLPGAGDAREHPGSFDPEDGRAGSRPVRPR